MILQITEEMREALLEQPGEPVAVEDSASEMKYVLIEVELHQRAMDALRDREEDVAAIRAGYDAIQEGRMAPLADVDDRLRQRLGFPPRT